MQTIVYIGNKLTAHGNTPTTIDVLAPQLETLGVSVITAGGRAGKLARLLEMMAAIVKHREASAVLIDTYSTNAFYFAYTCSQLCRLLKVKYIPILHGGNLPHRFKTSPRLTKAVFQHSYTNIAISGYLEELLKQHGYKNLLIENNIDITKYPCRLRESISPKFLWVRAFDKIYNPAMAVKIFAAIHAQYPAATLTMVGPDKDGSLQECKTLATHLNVLEHINFTGRLNKEDWVKIAAEHDVFLNTSSFDNLPVSIIEALALGMIVVSTNPGGIPFLLQHGQNAFLSSVKDEQGMTDNILNALHGKIVVKKLSIAARKTAEKYDWQVVKNKWIELFKSLAADA